jgi:hypothetical protein
VTSRWPSSPHASNEINGRRYMCPDWQTLHTKRMTKGYTK